MGAERTTDPLMTTKILEEKPGIVLTPEDRAWLDSHRAVRVHHENDRTRFNFHKKGISQGFTIDIMNLLGKREGFHAP